MSDIKSNVKDSTKKNVPANVKVTPKAAKEEKGKRPVGRPPGKSNNSTPKAPKTLKSHATPKASKTPKSHATPKSDSLRAIPHDSPLQRYLASKSGMEQTIPPNQTRTSTKKIEPRWIYAWMNLCDFVQEAMVC